MNWHLREGGSGGKAGAAMRKRPAIESGMKFEKRRKMVRVRNLIKWSTPNSDECGENICDNSHEYITPKNNMYSGRKINTVKTSTTIILHVCCNNEKV